MKPPSSVKPFGSGTRYRLLELLSPWLPPQLAFALADRAADRRWAANPGVRRALARNLSNLLGAEVPDDDPRGRSVCRGFARYLVEFFSMRPGTPVTLDVEGGLHLERCRARGTILLTGHLGNWELGAALIRRMGVAITVVAQPHQDPQVDRIFVRQRTRCGLGVLPLGPAAARASLQRLKEGTWLGMPGDWDFGTEGIDVPFGAGVLRAPRGPAVLSLRSGAPVLPAFLIREGRWAFRLFVEPPIWPQRGASISDAVESLTRQYARVIARHARRFPDQWLMFHDALQPLGSGLGAEDSGQLPPAPSPQPSTLFK